MRRILIIATLLLLPGICLVAQQFPVQVTPQLVAPYTLQVSEYYSPGASGSKLNLLLLLRDFNKPSLQVRLRMSITGQSVSIATREDVAFTPITIESGSPRYIDPTELTQYFNANNLTFSGITQAQYEQTGKLPEGFYTFCFEVVEANTGQTVSNKGCTIAWLTLNDPPLLNIPRKAESVIPPTNGAPQNVLFQWTPRHTASPTAFNTDYIISIIELPDDAVTPEAAFASYAPNYVDSTSLTTYLLDNSKPFTLREGYKYAWRVRAKAKNGTQELAMFRNDGYSETFWFIYKNNCPVPSGISATPQGQRVDVTWNSNVQHLNYKVEYREKGNADAEWFELTNTLPRVSITDLKNTTTYEYRVGGACDYGVYTFSSINEFTTLDTNATTVPSCGFVPDTSVTTEPLLQLMNPGDTIKAGDFNVVVTKMTGSGTSFSGEGYVAVSWLANMKIGVRFTNITVATSKKLKTGQIETAYDPTEAGIASADGFFEGGDAYGSVKTGLDTADYKINFVISGANDIHVATGGGYDPATGQGPVTITVAGSNNESQVISADHLPVTIKDTEGNIYQANKDGTVTAIGKAGGEQIVNHANRGEADTDKATATFMAIPDKTVYGFDEYKPIYSKSAAFRSSYEKLKGDYYVPAKAMAAGKTDYIKVKITKADPLLSLDSLKFVSGKGIIYQAKPLGNDEYEIAVVGAAAGDGIELYALLKQDGDKTLNLGKILMVSYPEKSFTVKVVPVNGATVDIASIKTAVNKAFNPVNVTFDISLANNFQSTAWDLNGDGKMEIDAANLFTNYSSEMKMLHALFKKTPDYTANTYYLFVLNEASIPSLLGDMPRGGRFGYLFTNTLTDIGRTAAHELGHGPLILKHTFDGEGFDANDLPDNLMDNGSGTHLTKHQWDFLHDPPFFVSMLDGESDGFSAGFTLDAEINGNRTYVSPSGTPIKLPAGAKVKFNKLSDLDLIPNGALYWFQTADGKQYAANLGYYKSNMTGKASAYFEQNSFDGYFPVIDGRIDYTKDPFTGFELLAIQADRKVSVVALYIATNADKTCSLKRFIADYIVPDDVSLTIVNRKEVELSDEVENLTAPDPNPIPVEPTECFVPYPPDPNNKYLEQYYNNSAKKLQEWLSKKVKSSIKYYLYDCATNKAKYTITKDAIDPVKAEDQDKLLNEYNSGEFKEDIAIKACIDETGKWNYDFQYSKKVLDNADPRIKPQLQQVKDEIKKQVDEEMKNKRRFDQAAEPDYRQNAGDGTGEFYKEGMSLPKGVAAFLDIGKSIIDEAKLPEYMWDSGKRTNGTNVGGKVVTDYNNSPIHLPNLLNGGTDQLINQATETVQLVKTGYQFIRHPKETFNGIWNGVKTMNWQKIKKMAKSASGYDNFEQGGDRAYYQCGSSGVQVAMAVLTAAKKALKEGTEIVEEGGKEATNLDDFVVGDNADEVGGAIENATVYKKEVTHVDEDKLLVTNLENDKETFKAVEKNGEDATITNFSDEDLIDPKNPGAPKGTAKDVEDGMKEVDPPAVPGKTEFEQTAGKSGEWNKTLNKPKPDQTYLVDDGKFTYKTKGYNYVDAKGKTKTIALTEEVTVTELSLDKARDRNFYQQKKCREVGGLVGDDGGHLVGSQFNGPGEKINMVAMSSVTNRAGGEWYKMESALVAKLNKGTKITKYNVQILYDATGRPAKFTVSWFEDGKQIVPLIIKNE